MGFDNAFGNNIETLFVSEWDEYAQKTYSNNYPSEHAINGDITKVNAADIPDHDVLFMLPAVFVLPGITKGSASRSPLMIPIFFTFRNELTAQRSPCYRSPE